FAGKGFCSLGIATKEDGKDWKLFRIMSMFDPPTAVSKSTSFPSLYIPVPG
ncbi:hypothetical protein B0H10DRAFT_1833963, partial [Mycena sp. CBHHK59/15]